MTAATTQGTLLSDVNAPGFLGGVAFGTTIIPFSHTFATTELDDIDDRVQLAPLRARGGRNRFLGCALYWADLEGAAGTLRAKLVIHQNDADSEILAASAIFNTVSTAGVLYWIMLPTDLDDTDNDSVATFDFVVTAAAGNAIAANLKGWIFYE